MTEVDLHDLAGLSVAELQAVVALVAGTEVRELEVRNGPWRVALKREPHAGEQATPESVRIARSEALLEDHDQKLAITSPLVGLFRTDVRVGERVEVGRPLGAIESMGIRTAIDAPQSGVVEEVAAADGAPVEYGQTLFVLHGFAEERPA